MWNVLSKLFIVVIIVLAFPTGLILASQNANPGDTTYPIKRGMEGILQSIFSLNPITRAYFKTDLSNRRFKEAVVLLNKNSTDKTLTNTSLVEMLSTTAQASADIKKVSDPALKKKLADDLANKIATYRQGLLVVAKEKNQIPTTVSPTPIPTAIPTSKPVPTLRPGQPTPTPTQIQISQTPTPSPTPIVKICSDTVRNYSLCGGTSGYETYPTMHLLMVSERKNSCTGALKNTVTDDWDLKLECDQSIVGNCSADDLPACDEMLAKLQAAAASSQGSGGGTKGDTQSYSLSGGGTTPTPTPTPSPVPTFTPTPTPFRRSAYDILQQQADGGSGTSSATESGVQTSTSGGIVQGIATSISEFDLKNLINSLISIFK